MPIIPGYMPIPWADEELRKFSCSIDGIYTIKICRNDEIEYIGTAKEIALQMFTKYGKPYNRFSHWHADPDTVLFHLKDELNKEVERMERLKAFW